MSTKRIHRIKPGPRRYQETVVNYYSYAAEFFKKNYDWEPVRYTLYKYMRDGYPIAKGGPWVAMPIYMSAKRPMTTKESMDRFLTVVRRLENRANARNLCAA